MVVCAQIQYIGVNVRVHVYIYITVCIINPKNDSEASS